MIGGALVHPARTSVDNLLDRLPYLLPCATVAVYIAIVAAACAYFFKETHPQLRPPQQRASSRDSLATLVSESSPLIPGKNLVV